MSFLQLPDSLVDVEWFHDHLDHPGLVILDASWHMPGTQRNAYEEWRQEHIRHARFFDFDTTICDLESDLPHMLPDADKFTREVRKLGLNKGSSVVIYDSMGIFTSPRAWWMLRVMGFDNMAILNGGLPAWHRAGYDVEGDDDPGASSVGDFSAKLDSHQVSDVADVLKALGDNDQTIVDARPAPRFLGEVEEPRAGLRRGHMPGASNLPFLDLLDNGCFKPDGELKKRLADHFQAGKHTICSCGSGVTACILAYAAFRVGYDNISVYDGSWSEWGLPGDLPVVSE